MVLTFGSGCCWLDAAKHGREGLIHRDKFSLNRLFFYPDTECFFVHSIFKGENLVDRFSRGVKNAVHFGSHRYTHPLLVNAANEFSSLFV